MRRFFARIGLATLALILSVQTAHAQFEASEDDGGFGNNEVSNTDNFEHVGGETWVEGELTGSNFQMTDVDDGSGNDEEEDTPALTVSDTIGGGSSGGGGGSGGDRPAAGDSASSAAQPQTASSRPARPRPGTSVRPATPAASAPSVRPATTPFDIAMQVDGMLQSDTLKRAAERRAARMGISFFDTTDPACPVTAPVHGAAPAMPAPGVSGWLLLGAAAFVGRMTYGGRKRLKKFLRKKKNRAYLACAVLALAGLLAGMTLLGVPTAAHAENSTTPALRIYKGTLGNAQGKAVTTPVTIRFSYWKSADYVAATDVTGTGAINTGAPNFLGWYEMHTLTPNAKGAFSVTLGSLRPLVNFKNISSSDINILHLQVEVKNAGSPDTAYEVLDVNPANPAIDRSAILPVPLARNSDLLDQHDTGTGAADIPVLNNNGKLLFSTIPGGTNENYFKVDADGTGTGLVSLQFGNGLAKQLQYDNANGRFSFMDDVMIVGDLTVTGLINGVDLSAIASSTGALKAVAGAGLNLNVSAGSYRLNGNVVNFPGNGGVAMPANQTVFVFFGSGGLTARTTGFPTDESHIPVAEVHTDGTSILDIDDRRVLSSDDRETNVETVYYPEFQNAAYQGDGADNVGQLVVGHDSATKQNFYQWSSTRPDLQDYDVLLKARLPSGFTRWQTGGVSNALAVQYRSTATGAALAKLDIQVYDTNGTPVTLSGAAVNLNALTWQTTGVEFEGGTWTPGQEFLIRLRMHAKDSFQIHAGSLKLRYVDFKQAE